jgi:hypothetical protein
MTERWRMLSNIARADTTSAKSGRLWSLPAGKATRATRLCDRQCRAAPPLPTQIFHQTAGNLPLLRDARANIRAR